VRLARVVRGAALVGLENVALWHERDISHSSAERVVVPDAFLALDYMLDRFAWLVEGLVVFPERMRRNLEQSQFLFFSQRVLLALVESGLARDEAYRLVQRASMRAWEEEQDFRELVRATARSRAAIDLDEAFSLEPYTRHVDTVFERLHALVRTRERSPVCLKPPHVGSGKVASCTRSTTSVCCSSRATGSRPSTSSCRPRSRTRARADRAVGFWFARTTEIVPNHLLALREDGRSTECRRLEMLPIECVVRGYSPGPAGRTTSRPGDVGHACRRAARVGPLPEPIFTPATKAQEGHDENIDAARASELVGEERFREVERVALALYAFAAEFALERGIIIADTSSSSGSTRRIGSSSVTRR
jgi:hypothetical protein